MPLGILIPLFSPIVTELVKWFWEKAVVDIPPAVIPLVSAAVGTLCAVAGPPMGVDLGVSPAEGAALGLAGTGLHQVKILTLGK